MGLGLIFDDLCVFVGVIVVWVVKGCEYSLRQKLREIKFGDFWCRREGVIGLATILILGVVIWITYHFLK